MKKTILLLLSGLLLAGFLIACKSGTDVGEPTSRSSSSPLKVLIVDGQNNHDFWPMTTVMMKQYLEDTGLFEVEVKRTAFAWKGKDLIDKYKIAGVASELLDEPKVDPNFRPDFSKYDVVLSNMGWNAAPWPEETQKGLEKFVSSGGGLVVVHAADNSFPKWLEYNKMIGLGGWGDRTEKDGPYVYFNDEGEEIRDTSEGRGGSHGPQHEFTIQIRDKSHPITQGMPDKWLHTKDELYDKLRGPAENMTILATAYSSEEKKGTGRHEPMLIALDYGKGRVFHTPMGHADYSMECVGYILSLTRGAEWAATGKVSQTKIPADFPTESKSSSRPFTRK